MDALLLFGSITLVFIMYKVHKFIEWYMFTVNKAFDEELKAIERDLRGEDHPKDDGDFSSASNYTWIDYDGQETVFTVNHN